MKPSMFDAQPRVPVEPIAPTEQQCKDAAVLVGGTEADGAAFFVQYAPQGFFWGNGMPITDLKLGLRRFLLNSVKYGPPPTNETTADRLKRIEQEKRV